MIPAALLCFALYLSSALAFSTTVGSAPTQCGSLNISWTGGQAPFRIMLTPAFDVPLTIDVPSSAFSNNQGSYQVSPFTFWNQTRFLVTMSDASGFGTGGTSQLLTVASPVNGASCDIYAPTLAYTFSLPSSLQQCNSYTFSQYDGASLPVTVTGLIPGGQSFTLQSPSSGSNFSWTADVAAGTTIIFAMTDAQGRSGGSSDTQTVASSNTASCLNSASPSSTTNKSPSSASSTSSITPSPTHTSSVPTGAIVGAAVGGFIAVAAIIALAICYRNRPRYSGLQYGLAPTRKSRRPASMELDSGPDNFQHPPIYPFPYQSDSATHLPAPITSSMSGSGSGTYRDEVPSTDPVQQFHSRSNSHSDGFAAFGNVANSTTSMSSSSRRKATMAGMANQPAATRFIVHTDAEDDLPVAEPEVVELPPQYTERRQATSEMQAASRPMSSATGISTSSLAYASG